MGSIDLSHWLMFTFDAKTTVRETELFDVYPRLSRLKETTKCYPRKKFPKIYGSESFSLFTGRLPSNCLGNRPKEVLLTAEAIMSKLRASLLPASGRFIGSTADLLPNMERDGIWKTANSSIRVGPDRHDRVREIPAEHSCHSHGD
nr:uncharacterized protein LOC109422179 isoform X2 [Aedes albopictus]